MSEKNISRGYLSTVLGCRCPRCREGKLFQFPLNIKMKNIIKMHKECLVCGQPTEIEVGFYYGTSYVSYALTVFLSGVTFIVWFLTIGISVDDNRFIGWLIANAVFLVAMQPGLMRLSRSLWISWFVKYDPDWRTSPIDESVTERVVKEQMDNW